MQANYNCAYNNIVILSLSIHHNAETRNSICFLCTDISSKYQTNQEFAQVTSLPQQTHPQFSKAIPEAFSEKMTCEQLELWLNHHMHLDSADYHEDAAKLKGRLSYLCTFLYNTSRMMTRFQEQESMVIHF